MVERQPASELIVTDIVLIKYVYNLEYNRFDLMESWLFAFREGDSVPSGFSAVNNTSDTNEEALKECLALIW